MEILAKLIALAILVSGGLFIVLNPWARQRWGSLAMAIGSLALMGFTLKADVPYDGGWATTFTGGTWWSWILIIFGVAIGLYGAFRRERREEEPNLTDQPPAPPAEGDAPPQPPARRQRHQFRNPFREEDGDGDCDWPNVVYWAFFIAVLLWILQGHLMVNLGDTVFYPIDGSGATEPAGLFLATAKCGVSANIPLERISSRPGIGNEHADKARLIWTGLNRPVISGIDIQIPANNRRLPRWAKTAFNGPIYPQLHQAPKPEWIERMTQMDCTPDIENFGIEVVPPAPPAKKKPAASSQPSTAEQIAKLSQRIKELEEQQASPPADTDQAADNQAAGDEGTAEEEPAC